MRVGVASIGMSRFGRRHDVNVFDLVMESLEEVFNEGYISPEDIDYVIFTSTGFTPELSPAGVYNEYFGLNPKAVHRVEAACASGSAGIYTAYNMVRSGAADNVLVIGLEKMNELETPTAVEYLARLGSYFWEVRDYGITFPGYYALFMTRYMHEYGASEEDFCQVAVKNHYYGARNPKAQYQREITIEMCMESRYISRPIKLYDCSPLTDGSAAVIISSEDSIKRLGVDTPIWIEAIGNASMPASLTGRSSFTSIESAKLAAEKAYMAAGIENPIEEIDVATVHDCFTIAEILAYEDLGFAKPGEGVNLIRDGETYIGGKIPVNLDGGLKAKGHPVGATGIAMYVEIVKQLRGEAERGRQAPIEKGVGLTHNIGGIGQYAYVSILRR